MQFKLLVPFIPNIFIRPIRTMGFNKRLVAATIRKVLVEIGVGFGFFVSGRRDQYQRRTVNRNGTFNPFFKIPPATCGVCHIAGVK